MLASLAAIAVLSLAPPDSLTPFQTLTRSIFAELIGINTTHDHGGTTPAVQALERRLRAAGFAATDIQMFGPRPQNQSLVVRLRGTGKRRPILLLAHLDVVEALRSDWTLDPFTLTERDGFFYGRGSSDIKDMAAIWIAILVRFKQERFVPDRDIIVALTAGEESGGAPDNGVQWLVAHHRDWIDAAYCINGDAGDPLERSGKKFARTVEASEKVYHDLEVVTRDKGGHSSQPTSGNAIYRLARALDRLARYRFPASLNEVTRAYFTAVLPTQPESVATMIKGVLATPLDSAAATRLGALAPIMNATLRTTCVATRIEGGHANNALPQSARAVVNCRVLPQERPDAVLDTLRRVIGDSAVAVNALDTAVLSPPSPLLPEVLEPVSRLTRELWGDVPVVPNMETGATDGIYLRNIGMPVFGISGVFLDVDDIRAHGKDERIGVRAFYDGAEFSYRLVKALSQ